MTPRKAGHHAVNVATIAAMAGFVIFVGIRFIPTNRTVKITYKAMEAPARTLTVEDTGTRRPARTQAIAHRHSPVTSPVPRRPVRKTDDLREIMDFIFGYAKEAVTLGTGIAGIVVILRRKKK